MSERPDTPDSLPLDGGGGEPDDTDYIGARDLARWRSGAGQWLAALAVRAAGRVRPHVVALLIGAAGLALCTLFAAGAEEVYDQVLDGEGLASLDRPVLRGAVALRTPGLTRVVAAFTQLGGAVGLPLLAGSVLIGLAVRRRTLEPVVLGLVAAAGSLLMTVVGKSAVGRARPPLADAVAPYESSFSFPSGHALNSLVLAGVVAYVVLRHQRSRRARVLTPTVAATFAVLVGLSRVYLGAHWLTDVVVAWALGLAWLVVVVTAHRLYLTSRRARRWRRGPAPAAG